MKRRRIGLLTCEVRERGGTMRASFRPRLPIPFCGTVACCGRSTFAYSCGAVADFHRLPVHSAARFCGLQTGTTRGASGCRTAWLSSESCGEKKKRTHRYAGLSLSGPPSKSEASRGFLAGLLTYAVSGRPTFPFPLMKASGEEQWLFRSTQRNHSGGAALASHQTSQFVERSRPPNNAKNAIHHRRAFSACQENCGAVVSVPDSTRCLTFRTQGRFRLGKRQSFFSSPGVYAWVRLPRRKNSSL